MVKIGTIRPDGRGVGLRIGDINNHGSNLDGRLVIIHRVGKVP